MIRALWLGGALLLAGCASPVVTRIDTGSAAALSGRAGFALAPLPGGLAPVHERAVAMVAGDLAARGWRPSEVADTLLWVTLSDRPADSRLSAGDDGGKPQAVIGPRPDRRNNRGCARRDYRLTVKLTDQASGAPLYAGSAAEFHCKATLDDALPHLVRAALAGLDGSTGVRQVEREGLR